MDGEKPQKSENQSNQNQQKLDLSKSHPVVCKECGYDVFIDGSKFRKISKIVAGTNQDVIVPMETLLCGNCGEISEELQSPQMKALEQLDKEKSDEYGK